MQLSQFQYIDELDKAPRFLALHEFSGDALPWEALKESLSTDRAKKVIGALEKQDMGVYKVRRVYPESEWGHVGK
ncbi:hypothetical protein ACJQWK_00535 [Exserohilum turcicum]